MLNEKLNDLIKTKVSDLHERGDFWHPDPAQDRKLGGPGANHRAREDREAASQPKEDPKKLRPGESYSEYAKRQGGSTVTKPAAKPSLTDRLKNKLGKAIDKIGGINSSYEPDGEVLESAVPGKPAERLGAVTAIPQSERDAAKARLLAKTAAKRKEMEKVKEELEIEEGMTMKDFKANRRTLKRREASADAKKRGHVGKEWYNSGRTYSPDEAKRSRENMQDHERRTRHRSAVDPDNDNDEHYSADKTKNPKKLRKQKAMGEAMSFSDFMEARRMDKEGVDRGDSRRAERADKARESLAAKQKRQAVLDKHEKKTGTKLDISRSKEGREHAANFPGSRQEPKEKGKKETPLETHNRRVNTYNARILKHGRTTKQKKEAEGMAKHTSRFD